MGVDCQPATELASAAIGDILARLERLVDKGELDNEKACFFEDHFSWAGHRCR
jgi:hypothetical protein